MVSSDSGVGFIYFHCLDTAAAIPRTPTSVKVDFSLEGTAIIDRRLVDPADLTWCFPMSDALSRWSQIKEVIKVFTLKLTMSVLHALVPFYQISVLKPVSN